MIDLNKKYKTRNGYEVVLTEIVDDRVFGRIKNQFGNWQPLCWGVNGSAGSPAYQYDLVEIPIPEFQCEHITALSKFVLFHGMGITIPATIKWLAVNPDGILFGFVSKPRLEYSRWVRVCAADDVYDQYVGFGRVNHTGDWTKSLVNV